MNNELFNPEVQQFIDAHLGDDPVRLLLKRSPFPGVSMQEIAGQIKGKQKCRKKLPTWYHATGICYPSSLALEQCSSEVTGAYKAGICAEISPEDVAGNTLADLTGGAGVDSYFFAKRFREVIHIERSGELSAIAAHNLPLLGARNVRFICGNEMDLLKPYGGNARTPISDWIYLDPSRRGNGGKKVFLPQDYEPDFIPHVDRLLAAAPHIMIKTSPLIDLSYGIGAFGFVREIHVVAVKNECKEILWILGRKPLADPRVICASIDDQHTSHFVFSQAEEAALPPTPLSHPLAYLCEPGAAILKAGAFKTAGARWGLAKLHVNSHLYTSDQPVAAFPGRTYRLIESLSAKEFSRRYKGRRINLSTRNFPESADALAKKHQITPGGDDHAFFTTVAGKHVVLICHRLVSG